MPPEPSVTSACEGPRLCTLRYSSALLPKSFERPGPKSVSPATYCSGVEVVVWWRWIVDMRAPYSMRSDLVHVARDARLLPLHHAQPRRTRGSGLHSAAQGATDGYHFREAPQIASQ